jgi:para-nitrobenzyl esterase
MARGPDFSLSGDHASSFPYCCQERGVRISTRTRDSGAGEDGAVHSADLPYVFGFYPKTGNIAGPFGAVDFKIADWVETYWANFARSGDPNGASVPNWPEFSKSQNYISITQDGTIVPHAGGLRPQQCELYRNILESRRNLDHR